MELRFDFARTVCGVALATYDLDDRTLLETRARLQMLQDCR